MANFEIDESSGISPTLKNCNGPRKYVQLALDARVNRILVLGVLHVLVRGDVMRQFAFLLGRRNRTRALFSKCWGQGALYTRSFEHQRININHDLQMSLVLISRK
jgi:hypothetical protein